MWDPESYTIIANLLPRLIGLIYFFAFSPFLFQIRGLIGSEGILPIKDFLALVKTRYPRGYVWIAPTLFWWNASDKALIALTAFGTCISLLLIGGFSPTFCLLMLFIIYLSIVSVGQEFLSFGWESFLLEITFYTFWVSLTPVPNLMLWISLNFLLFRFNIQAGAVKLQSGDINWRNLTGLAFHYLSQPLPNTQAWFVYKCPLVFHKASTLFMFFAELIVPFGLFFTDTIRAWTGFCLIGLQIIIWFTGNFSYLNHLTVVLSMIAFSNVYLSSVIEPVDYPATPWIIDSGLTLIGAVFVLIQALRLYHHFWPRSDLNRFFSKFWYCHLFNRYGLFAVMTTERIEIVIEGSQDGENWEEYLCKYKPSEVTRRPRRISPFQPRLDWQLWFLPFDTFERERWFHLFLHHLLKGTPEVLKLLRYNPFPDKPPAYIRALMYDYQFSSFQEKKELGWWWRRTYLGPYSPTFSLKER